MGIGTVIPWNTSALLKKSSNRLIKKEMVINWTNKVTFALYSWSKYCLERTEISEKLDHLQST